MELASGGVHFPDFGLRSARELYELLSSLRDGPEAVRSAVHNLSQLKLVLERLERSQVLAGASAALAPDEDARALASHVEACREDLEAYERRLGKLTVRDNETAAGRYWKRMKTVLSEKDLERMSAAVAGHVSIIGLHLDAVQR